MRYADSCCNVAETEENGRHIYVFNGPCHICKKVQTVKVRGDHLYAYRAGASIQNAMPLNSAGEREFLMSGICEPCFDKTFAESEDPENEEDTELTPPRLMEALMEVMDFHTLEGSTGVRNLAKIAGCLGYRDSQYFGQFQGGSYGVLINFLEDNPGCCEAMVEWMTHNMTAEWEQSIQSHLPDSEE